MGSSSSCCPSFLALPAPVQLCPVQHPQPLPGALPLNLCFSCCLLSPGSASGWVGSESACPSFPWGCPSCGSGLCLPLSSRCSCQDGLSLVMLCAGPWAGKQGRGGHWSLPGLAGPAGLSLQLKALRGLFLVSGESSCDGNSSLPSTEV